MGGVDLQLASYSIATTHSFGFGLFVQKKKEGCCCSSDPPLHYFVNVKGTRGKKDLSWLHFDDRCDKSSRVLLLPILLLVLLNLPHYECFGQEHRSEQSPSYCCYHVLLCMSVVIGLESTTKGRRRPNHATKYVQLPFYYYEQQQDDKKKEKEED